MILFYYFSEVYNVALASKFQFHYDLILFSLIHGISELGNEFQFHYDLILLQTEPYYLYLTKTISISL